MQIILEMVTDSMAASDLQQLANAVWIPLAGSVSDAACQPLVSPEKRWLESISVG